MMGSFQNVRPVVPMSEGDAIPASVSNTGIAALVPCYRLHEIRFGPELEALRAKTPEH